MTLTETPDSPVPEIPDCLAAEISDRSVAEIPNHLVAEIFLLLPTAKDLVRASAACVSFRRLVTDRSFLRRFRRLHAPPVLAFYDNDEFHHALPPHPSARATCALVAAADFSFSYMPNHLDWVVHDTRDGRVLLLCPGEGHLRHVSMELAVCDPLHRRYVLLPPVPDDLIASVGHAAKEHEPWCWWEVFLVPLEEEAEAEAAFGVIWLAHFHTRLAALVFSSSTGQWQAAASKKWKDLFLERGESTMVSPIHRHEHKRHYAYGCFYWESTEAKEQKKELLVLDTRTMEFSISDLPPRDWCSVGLAIFEAGEGKTGLFGILDQTLAGKKPDLCYYIKVNKGESSSKWQLEKTISLESAYNIKAAAGTYLLLGKLGAMKFVGSYPQRGDLDYISVDVKTFQLERVCSKSSGYTFSKTCFYTNFPPSLSSPTI